MTSDQPPPPALRAATSPRFPGEERARRSPGGLGELSAAQQTTEGAGDVPNIRPATHADLPAIDKIFRTSFCDTFAHLYDPENLATFLAQFTPEAWEAEFASEAYAFQVGELGGEVVGYAKLGPNKLPHVEQEGTIELKQLYLLKSAHGTGMAQALMRWTVDEARRRGARRLALSVWSENWRAQAFYRRFGFVDRGPVTFMVGNHPDEDRVWEVSL